MSGRIKLVKSYFLKGIEPEESPFLSLSLQVSLNQLSYALLEPAQRNVVGFQSYEFLRTGNYIRLSKILEELFEIDPWLPRSYESVRILIENHKATLVPASLYNPSIRQNQLQLMVNIDRNEMITDDYLPLLNARNIWAIHESFHNTLRRYFPLAQIHHHGSVLIESILTTYSDNSSGWHGIVNIRKDWFDLLVLESGKLRFYNTFRYHSDEDFIYFLIFTMEQLNSGNNPVVITFYGNVKRDDPKMKLTEIYCGDAQPGKKSGYFIWNPEKESDLEIQYFSLFNHYLCEL